MWQTQARLIYEFHEAKVKQHGKWIPNGKGAKVGWSIRDTAKALEKSPTTVSRMLKIMKAAKIYPFILTKYEQLEDAEKAAEVLIG